MAIIIIPSRPLDEEFDLKYATPDDTLQVISIDNGVVTIGFPSAQPYPPPYSCRALVNTRGITDLSGAWAGCTSITEFPELDFRSCVNFEGAWEGCTSLVAFPAGVFDSSQCSNYANAWFNCSLSKTSVDNILTSLDRSGVVGGIVDITGGGNSTPSSTGRAARASLRGKGWIVNIECDRPPYNCNTDVDTGCVTSLNSAWYFCTQITEFPFIDTSLVTDLRLTWFYCQNLRSFPAIDTSKVTDFTGAWALCSSLTRFPLIDTRLGVQFIAAWMLTGIYEFPALDVSSGVDFNAAWLQGRFTSFPRLDFSSGLDFQSAWWMSQQLVEFPSNMFDNCKATNFQAAWLGCALSQESVDNILVSIDRAGQLNGTLDIDQGTSSTPSLVGWYAVASLQAKGWTVSVNGDPPAAWPPTNCNTNVQTYGVTDFSYAWSVCWSISEFPMMNTSNVTSIIGAWRYVFNIHAFPLLDLGNVTSFDHAWQGCWNLESFPHINTSQGQGFSATWQNCAALTSFPELDFSKGIMFYESWNNCTSLVNFPAHMFDNCRATYFGMAWVNCALSQQSVDNILVSIDTAGQHNGTLGISGGTSSPPGPAGLTAKANLVSKGWTVTTNAPNYITTNLALYLDAGNLSSYPGSGTTWNDLSGNGYVGTLNGGVTYDPTNGGSLVFNGSTGYVLTNYTQTNVTQYTISVWFKGLVNGDNVLVSNRGVNGSSGRSLTLSVNYLIWPGFSFALDTDGCFAGNINNSEGSSSALNDGKWHNLVGVFDGQNGTLLSQSNFRLYIDGQIVTSNFDGVGNIAPPFTGIDGTVIGAHIPGLDGKFYQGKIANVMIYTGALTSQEVAQNYATLSPRFA